MTRKEVMDTIRKLEDYLARAYVEKPDIEVEDAWEAAIQVRKYLDSLYGVGYVSKRKIRKGGRR